MAPVMVVPMYDYWCDWSDGTDNGTVTFVVPVGAPSTLYYYCAAHHSDMGGQINVKTLRYRESIGAQIIEYADLLLVVKP